MSGRMEGFVNHFPPASQFMAMAGEQDFGLEFQWIGKAGTIPACLKKRIGSVGMLDLKRGLVRLDLDVHEAKKKKVDRYWIFGFR